MTSSFDENSIPTLAPTYRFQWEEVQDCYVVLYPEGMVKLSGSAGEIMKRCDGENNVKTILNDLQKQFQATDLKDDVLNFLEAAHDNGWIIEK